MKKLILKGTKLTHFRNILGGSSLQLQLWSTVYCYIAENTDEYPRGMQIAFVVWTLEKIYGFKLIVQTITVVRIIIEEEENKLNFYDEWFKTHLKCFIAVLETITTTHVNQVTLLSSFLKLFGG